MADSQAETGLNGAQEPDPLSPGAISSTNDDTQPSQSWFDRLKAMILGRAPTLRQDLSDALNQADDEVDNSSFSQAERVLLRNLLNLRHKRLDDVMVPRAEIVAMDQSQSAAELIAKFAEVAHSRIPIYAETLDDMRGMIHIKDLMRAAKGVILPSNDKEQTTADPDAQAFLQKSIAELDILRRVAYVPPSMEVQNLLQTMQATRLHMAIVVDEYGGTDGLVTIEDLIETVVGDIEDEHDQAELNLFRRLSENEFIVDARIELDDLEEKIGEDLRLLAPEEEADTLGGFVFGLVDRVPIRGECIAKLKGYEFEIVDADPRRIKRVKIVKRRRANRVSNENTSRRGRA